jgi:hypothetical protein
VEEVELAETVGAERPRLWAAAAAAAVTAVLVSSSQAAQT